MDFMGCYRNVYSRKSDAPGRVTRGMPDVS